jgi:hypothetical protein
VYVEASGVTHGLQGDVAQAFLDLPDANGLADTVSDSHNRAEPSEAFDVLESLGLAVAVAAPELESR